MVTTVELQNPMEYSLWVSIIAGLLIIIAVAFFIYFIIRLILKNNKKAEKKSAVPVTSRPIAAPLLKDKYIRRVQDIKKRYMGKTIGIRDGYQELSAVIREFVHEETGINVESLTAAEIKAKGIGKLDRLMEEYYVPEFAEDEKIIGKDLPRSCDTAEEVIRSWN